MKRKLGLCAIVTVLCLVSGVASADLVITITETGGGGFSIVGTGTGFVTVDSDPGEDDWDFNNFDTNFIANAAVDSVAPDTISGTMTNVTTSSTVAVTSLRIDSDLLSTGADDFTIKTDAITFLAGEEFAIDFSGSYLAGTLPFSDLNVGSFILTPTVGDDEEVFGIVTVNTVSAVPEPSSLAMLMLCSVAGIFSRRRR